MQFAPGGRTSVSVDMRIGAAADIGAPRFGAGRPADDQDMLAAFRNMWAQ